MHELLGVQNWMFCKSQAIFSSTDGNIYGRFIGNFFTLHDFIIEFIIFHYTSIKSKVSIKLKFMLGTVPCFLIVMGVGPFTVQLLRPTLKVVWVLLYVQIKKGFS